MLKDRKRNDLAEVEKIKKRWKEYTEELYKKDNHNDVIINLEPDILEYEVKQALGSIIRNKVSGGDGISDELFKILKDDAVKVLHGSDGKASACGMTQVRFLGWEDPLEKEMAIHSSTFTWKIPWTEEPERLQSMGLQRVGHD